MSYDQNYNWNEKHVAITLPVCGTEGYNLYNL
jgi:hypothetical protein